MEKFGEISRETDHLSSQRACSDRSRTASERRRLPPFCPLGPCVVTADELTDPHSLDLRLTIDGEVMQRAKTRDLIFDIPTVLGHISAIVLLQPGDIVSTGTPHGVGLGATPQRWMRP